MQKEIQLEERIIPYTLKVSTKARRLRLAVHPGGEFVVTAPHVMRERTVEAFILRKSAWVIGAIDRLSKFAPVLPSKLRKKEYHAHKETARRMVHEKLAKFNEVYRFRYNNVSIRNQTTRWGSCSKKGNLNFNYKIALLSDHLADYLVVHELCHTEEFNHSKKFWNLVAKTIPNYVELRRGLKRASL